MQQGLSIRYSSRRFTIASIIIDGYNLIGTGHRNLEKAREELCQALIAYRRLKEHEIILVFDGHKGGTARGSRNVRGGMVVMYTGQGESADDAIKRLITQERRGWIVISSDRSIEQYAWSHDAVPVPSVRFEAILGRILATEFNAESIGGADASVEGDDAEELAERPSSGNPHRTSKRDRALQRALRKLGSVGREQ